MAPHSLWNVEWKGIPGVTTEIMGDILGILFGSDDDEVRKHNKWLCVIDKIKSTPEEPFWLIHIDLVEPIRREEMEDKLEWMSRGTPNKPDIMKLISDNNEIPNEIVWNCICGQEYAQYNIPVVWEEILWRGPAPR